MVFSSHILRKFQKKGESHLWQLSPSIHSGVCRQSSRTTITTNTTAITLVLFMLATMSVLRSGWMQNRASWDGCRPHPALFWSRTEHGSYSAARHLSSGSMADTELLERWWCQTSDSSLVQIINVNAVVCTQPEHSTAFYRTAAATRTTRVTFKA